MIGGFGDLGGCDVVVLVWGGCFCLVRYEYTLHHVETEGNEDRLDQLDAMRLRARTWNCVRVLAVTSSPDLVGVEVLGVGLPGRYSSAIG